MFDRCVGTSVHIYRCCRALPGRILEMFSKQLILGILAIAVAYYYNSFVSDSLPEDEEEKRLIVEAWQRLISVPKAKFSRICVGLVKVVQISQIKVQGSIIAFLLWI